MIPNLEGIKGLFGRSRTFGAARSSHWRGVRQKHIKNNPVCAISGKKMFLHVHHLRPFHLYPELELEPSNLVTLTRWHHLWFGHFGSWKSYNENLLKDIERVRDRP